MSIGIVLIHGYTGSKHDLNDFYKTLCHSYGSDSVSIVSLPFHGMDQIPVFDQQAFEQAIMASVNDFTKKEKALVFIGHSTGGTLILSCMKHHNIIPDLLILAGTPRQIDTGYIERWGHHTKKKQEPDFTSIAKMISLINAMGKTIFTKDFPVLILNGDDDELVLRHEASMWRANFTGKKRVAFIPGADHHFLIDNRMHDMFLDMINRAVFDIKNDIKEASSRLLTQLKKIEPEVNPFLLQSPQSGYHLSKCPGGKRVIGEDYHFPESVDSDPVFANIEITTHCQLECRFCARTKLGIKGKNMSVSDFSRILDLLPHAYRITLVGLGEPLLHPDIIAFVKMTVSDNRRVALVTNAINLDKDISKELINAGLESIAFSIDGHDQTMSGKLRYGTDVEKVVRNIKQFTSLCKVSGRQISKAVFSALSLMSLPSLEKLTDLVSELGVDVLMLSDLNFSHNAKECLWQNMDTSKLKKINTAIGRAFTNNLPVLSVHGLEEFGLRHRYKDFLAVPVSKLYKRSKSHQHCLSPWQTIPVNVDGDITICDCQPEKKIGNLFSDSFSSIWNGNMLKHHRQKMMEKTPPSACQCCPRF